MKNLKLYKFNDSPNSLTDNQMKSLVKKFGNYIYIYSCDVDEKMGIYFAHEKELKKNCYDIIKQGYTFESNSESMGVFFDWQGKISKTFHSVDEKIYDCNYFLKVIDRLKIILSGYRFLKIESSDYGSRAVFKKNAPNSRFLDDLF